jgi:dTDP-4-dehydrorhamnose reductase
MHTDNPDNRRKPILLLGGSGQIGFELRRSLAPMAPIVAVTRRACDLTDGDDVRQTVRDTEPSVVVNAAAYTAVDQAEEEPAVARAINGAAPGILAEECRRRDIPLVHYSTDYVFGGDDVIRRDLVETDPTLPVNVYGLSKLAGEQAIRDVDPIHLTLRTSWVYGLRGRNFLRTILRLAGERDEVSVVDDQHGSPTWARMLAEATAQILFAHWFTSEGLRDRRGLYHLCADGSATWCDFARAITDVYGLSAHVRPIPTSEYSTLAKRAAFTVLDCSKMRSTFNIRLPHWNEQLMLCVDENRQRRFASN